jgi:hypothetical protein
MGAEEHSPNEANVQPTEELVQEAVAQAAALYDKAVERPIDSEPLAPAKRIGPLSPDLVLPHPDWRLLLSPDSDEYKQALVDPVDIDSSEYQKTARMLFSLAPNQDK